jgi:hypothetical protein
MIESSRRSFIAGLISLVAAPAIVRAGSLMPVRVMLTEAPNMTATEVIERLAALDFPSPSYMIDLVKVHSEMLKIMCLPQRFLASP